MRSDALDFFAAPVLAAFADAVDQAVEASLVKKAVWGAGPGKGGSQFWSGAGPVTTQHVQVAQKHLLAAQRARDSAFKAGNGATNAEKNALNAELSQAKQHLAHVTAAHASQKGGGKGGGGGGGSQDRDSWGRFA